MTFLPVTETNDTNVQIKFLPKKSNQTAELGADGTPLYDFHYLLTTQPNVPHPDAVWAKFLDILRQSDLMDYIQTLPGTAPAAPVTTTTTPAVPVIPVLSFTEKQDIALSQPSDIANVITGLSELWANASGKDASRFNSVSDIFINFFFFDRLAAGVNASQSEVQIINQVPLDPPKNTAAGVPIQTLTYGVTLQNATNLTAVRANAETLLLTAPLLRQFVVLPEQANATTTANPVVIVLVPQGAAPTSTATSNVNVQPPVPVQVGNLHTFDGYVTNANDVALISGDLQTLWAQAYGVPPETLNFTVLSVAPLNNAGPTERPITRITYSVAAPNQAETPQVLQTFQSLVPQSSLATIIAASPSGATQRTPHSLRIAVSNANDMDRLTNGIRNSWISALSTSVILLVVTTLRPITIRRSSLTINLALTCFASVDLQAQPSLAAITLTNVQPENVATQNGVPISHLSYDLSVPSGVPVGPDQEAAFQRIILQSPAQQYIVQNAPSAPIVAVVPVVGPVAAISAPGVPVPFSFTDTAVLAAGTSRSRDRILGQIRNGYETALGEWIQSIRRSLSSQKRFQLT